MNEIIVPPEYHRYYNLNSDGSVTPTSDYMRDLPTVLKQDRDSRHIVSTIFLGLNHSFGLGEPVLFETIVFDKNRDTLEELRYCTFDEAVHGHFELCEKYIQKSLQNY